MLDVHPPHSPTHTWKDFFIHIATIVVGLLIAVGLEQTVEYIHRQHERHLLEHELHAEAEIIQRNAEIDIVQYDAQMKYLLARRKHLGLMIAHPGETDPSRPYTAPLRGHGVQGAGTMAILNPIWESARADGRLALLPEGLKRAYGVVSFRKDRFDARDGEAGVASGALQAFQFQLSDIRTPRTPDFSHMSRAQLTEALALTTNAFEKLRALRIESVQLSGEINLVLGDEPIDQQALTPADFKANMDARTAHPEDFARMADEIDAEDAARNNASPKPAK